jgi:Ulp1 family protease
VEERKTRARVDNLGSYGFGGPRASSLKAAKDNLKSFLEYVEEHLPVEKTREETAKPIFAHKNRAIEVARALVGNVDEGVVNLAVEYLNEDRVESEPPITEREVTQELQHQIRTLELNSIQNENGQIDTEAQPSNSLTNRLHGFWRLNAAEAEKIQQNLLPIEGPGDLHVTEYDLWSLRPGRSINVDVIDLYTHLFQRRLQPANNGTYIAPTHRYENLSFVRLANETAQLPSPPRLLLIPIHLQGSHFVTVAIDFDRRSITFYDSLYEEGHNQMGNLVLNTIRHLLQQDLGQMGAGEWTMVIGHAPHHGVSTNNCGVATIVNLQLLYLQQMPGGHPLQIVYDAEHMEGVRFDAAINLLDGLNFGPLVPLPGL